MPSTLLTRLRCGPWRNLYWPGSRRSIKKAGLYRLRQSAVAGFTLIELLVAISIMALLAVLSWRGLDGMARAQSQTSQRADEVLTLQAGLAQWRFDLDALAQTPGLSSLDWDGRVLKITRRTALPGDGLQVVAWTRRADDGGQWLRWQSPAFRTASSWRDAWERASLWAQNGSAAERAFEVVVSPLEDWQLFYFRGDAWSNPLSSAGTPAAGSPLVLPSTPGAASLTGIVSPISVSRVAVPDGVRLILSLPAGQALAGRLVIDWVRPALGGDKS